MTDLYHIILAIHNLVRWLVVIDAALVLATSYLGWLGNRPWSERDRRFGLYYTITLDLQMLLGLILYFFLSPITREALRNFGAAMSNPNLRFFSLEHLLYMLAAVVLAHIGRALSRRATDPAVKHRQAAIFYTLSVIAILLGMPWFRPLLPSLGGG